MLFTLLSLSDHISALIPIMDLIVTHNYAKEIHIWDTVNVGIICLAGCLGLFILMCGLKECLKVYKESILKNKDNIGEDNIKTNEIISKEEVIKLINENINKAQKITIVSKELQEKQITNIENVIKKAQLLIDKGLIVDITMKEGPNTIVIKSPEKK